MIDSRRETLVQLSKKYKPFVQLRHAPILTVLSWMQTKIKNTHPLFGDTIRADDDLDPASESKPRKMSPPKTIMQALCSIVSNAPLATFNNVAAHQKNASTEDKKYKPYVQVDDFGSLEK